MPASSELVRARGKYGAYKRTVKTGERQPDDPDYIEAQRDLVTARIEAYVTKAVAQAPPLTPAQIAKLTGLFDYDPPKTAPARKPRKPVPTKQTRGRRSA
ncbi:MAG: hypothetical protein ACLP75_18095 [Mycobacterium sp.]|uniref:hypothetical protein n=1 Tax=Mycobacterium sp. TaxID=1785 RepID=UPI003F94556A